MKIMEGKYQPVEGRIAIILSRFNGMIVENLKTGALDALMRHGYLISQIDVYYVPGAFELPLIAKKIVQTNDKHAYKGILALGAIIRGSTPHFEYVAAECTKGLSTVSLEAVLPLSFGVLTTDTIEQAIERAGTKSGNKGFDSACALIEMMHLMEQI